MQINFDNCDVAINSSGILASNANIDTNNSIEAAYVLGYTRPINQIPIGPIKTSFNASYLPIISQEPNYAVVNKIKSMINDSGYMGEKVEVAGITHNYCFLNDYNIKISPNSIVEASVSYSTFWELCGNTRQKSNRINYLSEGDICHSWATYILNSGDYITNPVYDFNYSFKANWQPIYVIGQKYPIEVKLLSAEESISFNIDNYRNILFTGEEVYNNIFQGNNGNLQFKNISITCQDGCDSTGISSDSLSLNISGFKIKSINPSIQVGEFLRTSYVANKYY